MGRRRHRRPGRRCCVAILAQNGITQAVVTVEDDTGRRAVRDFPDRFFPSISVDPNEGMETLRKIDRYADEFDLRAVGAFPAGLTRRSR